MKANMNTFICVLSLCLMLTQVLASPQVAVTMEMRPMQPMTALVILPPIRCQAEIWPMTQFLRICRPFVVGQRQCSLGFNCRGFGRSQFGLCCQRTILATVAQPMMMNGK